MNVILQLGFILLTIDRNINIITVNYLNNIYLYEYANK